VLVPSRRLIAQGALVFAEPRPRLRGVSHRIACGVAIAAGTVLVIASRDRHAAAASAVYAALLVAMFGVSATLHGRDWGPRTFGWWRRADHAIIFAFIAGTYTPLCLVGIGGATGTRLLALVWIGAGLGIVRALVWPHAPRVVASVLYVVVGWLVVWYLPSVRAALDPAAFALLIAGGAIYTVGAVVYALRWPDPWPQVFGYHEVFHALIIVASGCHFAAVARVVTSP
jgi:hemolysin III